VWLIVKAVQHIVGGNNVVELDTGNYNYSGLLVLYSCRWKEIRLFDFLADPFFLTKPI
jgi:multisubunit Na+/H+ antiporter MnhF subunit